MVHSMIKELQAIDDCEQTKVDSVFTAIFGGS